jgi:hypothetical protein
VNNGALTKICNLDDVVCCVSPYRLENEAQRKHKRLVNYNKNHGTSILFKNVYREHLDFYKKWGFLFSKRLQNPKMTNKLQRRGKLNHLCISQFFLVTITLTTNQFF